MQYHISIYNPIKTCSHGLINIRNVLIGWFTTSMTNTEAFNLVSTTAQYYCPRFETLSGMKCEALTADLFFEKRRKCSDIPFTAWNSTLVYILYIYFSYSCSIGVVYFFTVPVEFLNFHLGQNTSHANVVDVMKQFGMLESTRPSPLVCICEGHSKDKTQLVDSHF